MHLQASVIALSSCFLITCSLAPSSAQDFVDGIQSSHVCGIYTNIEFCSDKQEGVVQFENTIFLVSKRGSISCLNTLILSHTHMYARAHTHTNTQRQTITQQNVSSSIFLV